MEWIDEDVVLAIHEAQIAEHGGSAGLRDRGLLVSALERPENAADYSGADILTLAALYTVGIIRNHPFVDGNKRVGAVLLDAFLELHDVELTATDSELVEAILGVASGALSDEAFNTWVRKHVHIRH